MKESIDKIDMMKVSLNEASKEKLHQAKEVTFIEEDQKAKQAVKASLMVSKALKHKRYINEDMPDRMSK